VVAAAGLLLGWQRDLTASARQGSPDDESEVGIPIEDAVVRKTCATCHTIDQKGQISRLSFQRKTPEGWERTVRRMAALNGMQTDPTTARYVVKYLSNHLGLAPDEARPAAFEVERRQTDYKYAANGDAESVCTKCHSMGRVISQRRTKNEWHLLVALHRGLYPQVDFQVFRRSGAAGDASGERPADTRQPVQKAIDHLVTAFPLRTAAWTAWSATMRPPQIVGSWAIRGSEPGKGPFFGRAEIRASKEGASDEYITELSYTFAKSGDRVTRSGQVVVYAGYQWRGRSTSNKPGEPALREVMWVDREWRTISGRWFSGGYDELGLDVELQKIGRETTVLGADVAALHAGATEQPVKVYGVNLPAPLALFEIDFGPGITVTRVDASSPESATIRVNVAPTAAVGARDVVVARTPLSAAVTVYDRIHRIAVTPRAAMARVGGIVFPKMVAQFEARAYHNGPDNRPETADDLDLGVVPAQWALEEYAVRYGDDDVRFVGSVDEATGRFTPNVDGPNAERRGNANNIGDVWVVARFSTAAAGADVTGAALTARAHLLVTVPLYMRWESASQ
jgi:quinohemoprotein amine dehydrogenase